MKPFRLFCFLVIFISTMVLAQSSSAALKPAVLFVEGDSSTIPKFINVCRQIGPERGLDFHFVDKQSDKFDYRVILSAEGSSVWDFAHGNIVVMNPESKVLFTVTPANRWTGKGATNAMGKEFVKVMARYLDTPRENFKAIFQTPEPSVQTGVQKVSHHVILGTLATPDNPLNH